MTASAETLAEAVRAGDRRSLARAITLIESTRPDHREAAVRLLERLTPHAGKAIRVGISGVPGAGKSTFIEAFGLHVIDQGRRLAVLTIDPSSTLSGGSILGDKTRMSELSRRREAFIRPSPAGRTLGGVARRTREAMLLCEAAGFDLVLVETVGVGQSETAAAEMTDMFVLLLLPGGGDELQGIKRGIMELADLVLVNKADGELEAAARRAAAEYRTALRLLHPRSAHWTTPVETCSALTGKGIEDVWRTILRHHERLSASGEIAARRAAQARAWLWAETSESLMAALREHPEVRHRLPGLEAAVTAGRRPPPPASCWRPFSVGTLSGILDTRSGCGVYQLGRTLSGLDAAAVARIVANIPSIARLREADRLRDNRQHMFPRVPSHTTMNETTSQVIAALFSVDNSIRSAFDGHVGPHFGDAPD